MTERQQIIDVACPCGETHRFAVAHAGRVARCPKLRKRFEIPSSSGSVCFIEDAVAEKDNPIPEGEKPKEGLSPIQITKAIVTRAADLYHQHKHKKELAKAEYEATHCQCPHCASGNLRVDYLCKQCGCPLQDQQAAFLFMEKRRQEAHELRIAEMQTKGQIPQAEARPVPAYQPPPPVQKAVLNVQQNVVVKGRRNVGCLGSIVVLIVFIICIVVCTGLFSTSRPSDHSSPPSSVKTNANGDPKPNPSEKPSQLTNAISPTQARDSKLEKSEQSEAKQNEPQTPRDKLAQLLATAMGKSNRENVQKLSGLTIEAKEIRVEFAVDDNLTENMIKSSARRDVVEVLKTIHESGIPYNSIDVYGTFSMADRFGNSTEKRVISATYSKATVSRINWANFLPDNIYQIADKAVISPAFR